MELSGRENASKGDRRPLTIFHTPRNDQNWRYLFPEIFNIGPYCRFNQDSHKKIKKAEKEWFMKNLLSDLSPEDKDDVLERCRQQMRHREQEARRCYEKADKELDLDAFVEMLVLDGCFILSIMLLLDKNNLAEAESNSPGNMLGLLKANIDSVKLDLLRLRNQIPFFVLVDLVNILKNYVPKMGNFDLVDFALRPFQGVFSQRSDVGSLRADDIYHLLHLFHSVHVPTPDHRMTNTRYWEKTPSVWIPGAMELEKSNIICKKKQETTGSFLDISFRDGMLEIPSIGINGLTRPLFYNLIALEKLCNLSTQHISAYITFMGNIMHSEGDATHLCSEGIIATNSTAKDVADFFGTCRGYVGQHKLSNYLLPIIKEVNIHHRSKRSRWLAELLQKYCNSPWVIVSVVAGSILLVCTVLQTFYAMKSYYKQ